MDEPEAERDPSAPVSAPVQSAPYTPQAQGPASPQLSAKRKLGQTIPLAQYNAAMTAEGRPLAPGSAQTQYAPQAPSGYGTAPVETQEREGLLALPSQL